MTDDVQISTIPEDLAGLRLDQALAQLFPEVSRARLQRWIKDQHVFIDGHRLRPRDRVYGGEQVLIQWSDAQAAASEVTFSPEPIPLNIVFEDEHLIVLDKPAGLVVHPGAGNWQGTLLNALLNHAPELAHVPRAGIVHRLDKDTTGLLVVAKTLIAHQALVRQLKARAIQREYLALVVGALVAGGTIDAPIGRHPVTRQRMAVLATGRPAVTHHRVRRRFRRHTLLHVRLETGRTHQIRVHLAHIGYPVVGDPVYGGRRTLPPGAGLSLRTALTQFNRQALHAEGLSLSHPVTGVDCRWQAPTPADLQSLLDLLETDVQTHAVG